MKQHDISLSSIESEYRTLCKVVAKLSWLTGLLSDIGVHICSSILEFYDSKEAIHIAKNPVFHKRTKHIGVDCHFIRDLYLMD